MTPARRRATSTSRTPVRQRRSLSRQLARQQEVLRTLLAQRRPMAVEALAEALDVSERTVDRDLERLRAAELPLRGRGGSGGGVWLDVTRSRTPLALTGEQIMALLLALDGLEADLPETLTETRDLLRAQLRDPRLF